MSKRWGLVFPTHQKSKWQQQKNTQGQLDTQIIQRPGHPGQVFAGKANAPEDRCIQAGGQHRGNQWCAPPVAVAQFVEHRNIQHLRAGKRQPRSRRNAWWSQQCGSDDCHRKTDPCHALRWRRAKALVHQLADQKGKWVGDGTPDQSAVDGVLNEDVGGQHHHAHGRYRQQQGWRTGARIGRSEAYGCGLQRTTRTT